MLIQISILSFISIKSKSLRNEPATVVAAGSKVRDILGQINWVLFVEAGLRANQEDYYDPRNSYLNEVLDRGLGIPISLSVVYWAVANDWVCRWRERTCRRHFMLRFEEDGLVWFVDPFHAGAIYNREHCQQRLSDIVAAARGS